MRTTLIFLTLLFLVRETSSAAQSQKAHPAPGYSVRVNYETGVAWVKIDANIKLWFVSALFQGRSHGLSELAAQYASCDRAAAKIDGLLFRIPFSQLVDALDGFYSDPTNRQIAIADALVHIAMQIKGESQSTLQKNLEHIRRDGAFQAAHEEKQR